jgi:hypothetical protein
VADPVDSLMNATGVVTVARAAGATAEARFPALVLYHPAQGLSPAQDRVTGLDQRGAALDACTATAFWSGPLA